jgi:hypothetical protein
VSSWVIAASAPIDRPDAVRPVSLAAPRMVLAAGASTKSPEAEMPGGAPMRRE